MNALEETCFAICFCFNVWSGFCRLRVHSTSSFEQVAESSPAGATLSNVCFHPWSALLVGCSGDQRIPFPGSDGETSDDDSSSDCGTIDSASCAAGAGEAASGGNGYADDCSQCHMWCFDFTASQYSAPGDQAAEIAAQGEELSVTGS
jgi:hypothetical protein